MKKELNFLLLIISLLFLISNISALTNSEGPFYSMIGKERVCSVYPDESFEITNGESIIINEISEEICGDTNALINIFDNEWNPYIEYKDGSFICPFEDGCWAEVYCCPYEECTDNNICKEQKGIFSECKKIQCKEWKNGGYQCDVNGIEENIPYQYPEISYCTESSNKPIYISLGILLMIILIIIYLRKRK